MVVAQHVLLALMVPRRHEAGQRVSQFRFLRQRLFMSSLWSFKSGRYFPWCASSPRRRKPRQTRRYSMRVFFVSFNSSSFHVGATGCCSVCCTSTGFLDVGAASKFILFPQAVVGKSLLAIAVTPPLLPRPGLRHMPIVKPPKAQSISTSGPQPSSCQPTCGGRVRCAVLVVRFFCFF